MNKRITLICLFLLCIAGLKAQTYCYHLDAIYIQSGSGARTTRFDYNDRFSYYQFSFKGDFMLCGIDTPGSWKVDHIENGGVVHYDEYQKNMFGRWKKITYTDPYYHQNIKVSGDRNSIVYTKVSNSSTEIWYYHLYSTGSCY